jgi:Tol biopolymer transport system component
VFVSNRVTQRRYDVLVMNADGSKQTKITNLIGWNGHPDWSPDGARIVFEATFSGSSEIYIMNPDGSDTLNVTKHPAFDAEPRWSPDGTKIAFTSDRDGNYDVFVMNADGSNPVNLSRHDYKDMHPAWSPDGTKIAFTSDRDHVSAESVPEPKFEEMGPTDEYLEQTMKAKRKTDIFVMNADGSEQTNVTKYSNSDFQPTWSPDGTRIAFISVRNGKRDIFSIKPDGTDLIRITDDDTMQECPDWGPMLK